MKIYRPLKSNWITQGFGESKACVLNGTTKVISKKGLTCPVGYTDLYESLNMKGHNGVDHASYHGEPLYFPVVADCQWWVKNYVDRDGGIGLDVYSDRPIDIGELPPQCGSIARNEYRKYEGKVYVKFRFHHLKKSLVSDSLNNVSGKPLGYRDTKVEFGQKIALCDNTGLSSGNHLHWSMKIVQNNGISADVDNGYYGAVDFSNYYLNKSAFEIYWEEQREKVNPDNEPRINLAWNRVMFELRKYINSLIK